MEPTLTGLIDQLRMSGSREATGELLIKALAALTGDAVLGGLDVDELVCALHTLAERESDPDPDNLSERQREVTEKVLVLWSDQINGTTCERCHAEEITDEESGLGDECIANNNSRVHL